MKKIKIWDSKFMRKLTTPPRQPWMGGNGKSGQGDGGNGPKCGRCGKGLVPKTANYCYSCGARVGTQAGQEKRTPAAKAVKKEKNVLALLICLAIGLMVVYYLLGR